MRAKLALVTGAAQRIGACIAGELHRRGCKLLLHYHSNQQAVSELAAQLNATRPGSAVVVQADLCKPEDIEKLAQQVRETSDRLDLLVNNASRFFATTPGEPQDIASAVAYLGLDAPYVTGQILTVDGGRSLNM